MLKEKVEKFLDIGVSLKGIAAFSGIHYSTLSKWINGSRELTEQNKEKVSIALQSIVKELTNILE